MGIYEVCPSATPIYYWEQNTHICHEILRSTQDLRNSMIRNSQSTLNPLKGIQGMAEFQKDGILGSRIPDNILYNYGHFQLRPLLQTISTQFFCKISNLILN
jgi:hypothetical protein